jgi:hypothetical protein
MPSTHKKKYQAKEKIICEEVESSKVRKMGKMGKADKKQHKQVEAVNLELELEEQFGIFLEW